jgi:hypothetical protein
VPQRLDQRTDDLGTRQTPPGGACRRGESVEERYLSIKENDRDASPCLAMHARSPATRHGLAGVAFETHPSRIMPQHCC